MIGAESRRLFPVLTERYNDLGVYETTIGSGLLLGGTSLHINCLELIEEVLHLHIAVAEVMASVMMLNVDKI